MTEPTVSRSIHDLAALALDAMPVPTLSGPAWIRTELVPASARIGRNLVSEVSDRIRSLCSVVGARGDVIAALDLETTGLSGGAGCVAFVIGLAWIGNCEITLEQLFLPDFPAEPALLTAAADRLSRVDVLLTFNGKRFDWPLLSERFPMHRMHGPAEPPHIDVLHYSRRVWRERLANCRLAELERRLLGIDRHDDVPSHIVPTIYFDYLRSGRVHGVRSVLEHNRSDLLALAGLAGLLGYRLTQPVDPDIPAPDLCGLGRLRDALGRPDGGECYRAAAPEHELACRHLVSLHRRAGEYQRAAHVCRETLARFPSATWAAVELAKHLEHRERDFTAALAVVRGALSSAGPPGCRVRAELEHRCCRLERKVCRL